MLKHSLAYGTGNMLTALIPFLLLPFLTTNLEPSELGTVAFIESLILLISPLVIFGIDGSYSTFHHKLSINERASQSVALLQIVILISLMLIPIMGGIAYFELLPITIDGIWIFCLIFLFLSMAINALLLSQLQMNDCSNQYAVLKVCISLIAAVITVLAVLNMGKDATSRLLGIYSAPIIVSVVSIFIMYKRGIFNHDYYRTDMFKKGLYFGFGMVLHSWSAIVFFASDRFIIGYLGDVEILGKYSVAVQVGMVMAVIQNTFSQVWTPYSFRLFANNKFEEFTKMSHISIVILFLMCIGVMLLIPLLYRFFIDIRYHDMSAVTYWVVATYFFLGLYKIYVVKLFYFEKVKLLAKITTFTALFNVLLTIALIEAMGVIGAAIATFFSSIIFCALVYFFTKNICSKNLLLK